MRVGSDFKGLKVRGGEGRMWKGRIMDLGRLMLMVFGVKWSGLGLGKDDCRLVKWFIWIELVQLYAFL